MKQPLNELSRTSISPGSNLKIKFKKKTKKKTIMDRSLVELGSIVPYYFFLSFIQVLSSLTGLDSVSVVLYWVSLG